MAISSGVGPHAAWLMAGGGSFPILHGGVEQTRTRKSSAFEVEIPLNYPGALAGLLGGGSASVFVSSAAGAGVLITGQIDEVEADLIRTVIHVRGRDASAALHETKSSEKWTNKKGSEIVQDIAGRVGLSVQADASSLKAGKMVQIDWAKMTDGISYAYVIQKVAELDGAIWWVKNNTLYYRSKNSPSGTYTINYDAGPPIISDALDLCVRFNAQAAKNIKVTVKSWNPKKKQVFTGTAQASGKNGQLNYIYHIPNLDQAHAQQYATAKAAAHARHAYEINARLVGDPSIDVNMALQLSGTGFFDGQYQIDSIHHEFGWGGYTMEVQSKAPNSDVSNDIAAGNAQLPPPDNPVN